MTTTTEAAKRLKLAASTGFFGHYSNDVLDVADAILAPTQPVFRVGQRATATMDCWCEPHGRPRCIERGSTRTITAVLADGLRFEECSGTYPAECFELAPLPTPLESLFGPSLPSQTTPLVIGQQVRVLESLPLSVNPTFRHGDIATIFNTRESGDHQQVILSGAKHNDWIHRSHFSPLDTAPESEPAKPHSAEVIALAKQLWLHSFHIAYVGGRAGIENLPADECLANAARFLAAAKEPAK